MREESAVSEVGQGGDSFGISDPVGMQTPTSSLSSSLPGADSLTTSVFHRRFIPFPHLSARVRDRGSRGVEGGGAFRSVFGKILYARIKM